jgi:hypothetical protein
MATHVADQVLAKNGVRREDKSEEGAGGPEIGPRILQ